MPILEATHDLAHPVEADSAWSESYYFNAYDPATDTGFFTRIGIRPNEGTIDVGMSVWLPGDELAEYRFVREQKEMVDSVLEVGAVRYEMVEPMGTWRITMDGEALVRSCRDEAATRRTTPVEIDATFSALTPPVGYDGQDGARGASASAAGSATASTGANVGKGHFEQAGRWAGAVTIDGVQHGWTEARGNRDKSWGPRRWGGPRMWRWFSINVADDVHFGGIRIGTEAGDLHRGWVWRDGVATSVREWRVSTQLDDDEVTHRATDLTVVDKSGREHELHGEILRVAAIGGRGGGRSTLVNEGLARWSYEGLTGYGISEYLHQLDDDGRPSVAIE